MKSGYSDKYNVILNKMKDKTLKKLIGSEYIDGMKKILDLRNNYSMTITDDSRLNKALDLLTNISNIDNINDLAQLEESLNENNLKDFQEIIEPLKKEDNIYKQAHIDYLTDFDSMNKEEVSKQNGVEISQRDGVNIYELKGIPFNFMVHDGNYDGNTYMGTDNVHTTMLNSEKNTDTIHNSRVLLVFNNISVKNINFMTTRDAGTWSDDIDKREETRMLPDEFFANMGEDDGHYNDYQLNTQNGTLQPNAICIKGKITDKDIEFAKQRGIKAIYSIDEESYKKNNEKKQEQFDELLSEYNKSFNPKMIAMLKSKNPYSRDEFLDIIKTSIIEKKENGDKKLLNANINTLKRVFRRELLDANRTRTDSGDRLLEEFANIEKLQESDELIISEGSNEEKDIKRFIKIEILQKALKEKSARDSYSAVLSILDESDDFDKDISSIIAFIKENCNLEDIDLYESMILSCEMGNIFDNGGNPEIKTKIEELKSNIAPEKLQERGQVDGETSLGKIHSYFVGKSPSIDEIVSSISTIKEERAGITEKSTKGKDLLGSAIEATEETTRFDSINEQRNKIVQLQKERTQTIDNKNMGRE